MKEIIVYILSEYTRPIPVMVCDYESLFMHNLQKNTSFLVLRVYVVPQNTIFSRPYNIVMKGGADIIGNSNIIS